MWFEEAPFWFGTLGEDLSYAVGRRTAAWLRTVIRASALVLAACTVAAVASRSMPVWSIYGAFALATLVALVLEAKKRTRAAGVALSAGFWLASTAAVFLLGGVRSPGTFVYLPVVVTAGLFWSWRAAAGLTAASLLVEIAAESLRAADLLPTPLQATDAGSLLRIFAGSLTMTAVLVGVALHSLRGALADVRRYALRTEEILLDVPDVIAVVDRLGVVLGVSPRAKEVTGYAPSELVGRHLSRIELFAHERGAGADEFRGFLAGTGLSREIMLTRRDGEKIWADARKQSIALASGDGLVRVVLYDVTRRKRAEERQAELLRAIERAKRLQSMGLMVGGVAHDFNNLLTVILSVSSILETQLPDDPDARELLAELKQSAVRASGLAKQLLSTRPEAEDEPIDVHCELRALTPLFARLCGGRVTVEVFVDHEPCFVRIERAKLEQIAINLVVNARDAMPNGGRLAVKTSLLSADGRGVTRPCVELAVADTGVGMDTTTQQRMFEPFFTTKGDGGTGLGLANVDDIVTRVGGHVLVDSEIGRGTRVRVVLPLAEPFEAEPGEKVATDSSPPTSETLPESRRSNA